MKTLATAKWTAVLILGACLTANAQQPNGGGSGATGEGTGGTPPGGNGHGGQGVQHQRPSPEQLAQHLMEQFDANKDGELELSELTLAVQAMQAHHPGGAGGKQGGGNSSNTVSHASQNAPDGQHHAPPPADKIAAHMIAKFSSDGKGLTQAELAQAIAARQANHGQHGGGQQGKGGQQGNGGQQGAGSANGTSSNDI